MIDRDFKINVIRRFKNKSDLEWRNALIFMTLFEGIIKLFELKLLNKMRKLAGIINRFSGVDLKFNE